MKRAIRALSLIFLLTTTASAGFASQGSTPSSFGDCGQDGAQASGAIYRICMPPASYWNGDLVIWAHGYVAFNEPFGIPEDQLCFDTVCLPGLVNALGFAFATTSYATNGLAIQPGIADVVDLVDVFTAAHGAPLRVYLVGASEGGIVTVLAVEQHPDIFAAGLATCGPIGDFNLQFQYFGNFRVVFDYFFPGLLPGDAVTIPQSLIDDWDSYYDGVIRPAILDPVNQDRIMQLMRVTRAPFNASDPNTIEESIHDALWYNVFATNDAFDKLGGNAFDNITKRYFGSADDDLLNSSVVRVSADPNGLAQIEAHYQTTGMLVSPVVTLHTTKDQQVPYGHEPRYSKKVRDAGASALHVNIPIFRYGHCNFTAVEGLLGFAVMLYKATQQPLTGVENVLTDPSSLADFQRQALEIGLPLPATPSIPRSGRVLTRESE